MMKRLLLFSALCLLAPCTGAQSGTVQPNARITFDFTATGRSDILDNRFLGCTTFHATYSNTGFSVLSWEMDAAPNSSGVAGTWAAFGSSIGSLPSGSALPLTNTTGGQITGFKYTPFISVNLNSITGTGHVTGTLECWKPGGGQDASSSGGEPVVVANALPSGTNLIGKVGIDQTTPGTTNAVAVTNLPTTVSANLGSPDAGTIRVVTATATPADATPNANVPGVGGVQSYGFVFNGSTWDRIKGITGQTGLLGVGVVNSGTNAGDALSNGSVWTDLNNLGNSQIGLKGGMVFNNSTWDRTRSGATANLPNLIGSTLTANVAVDPCQSSAIAKQSASVNISSATTTSIVAISGSTTIYTCGWSFTVNGTTPTYQFEYGTGATCGTGTVVTTGVYAPTVGSFATYSPGMTAFPTIASQRLCIVSGGTGPSIQGVVTYVQQ